MFQVPQMFFVSQSRANLHLPYWRQNQNMERRHQQKATESDCKAGNPVESHNVVKSCVPDISWTSAWLQKGYIQVSDMY